VPAVPSLLDGVGTAVIDGTPPALKDWATTTLGTANKPVLLAGVIGMCAALGAVIGWLGARRPDVGAAAVGVLAAVGGAAAWRVSGPVAVLPAAVATAVGVAALRLLLGRLAGTGATGATGESTATAVGRPAVEDPERRRFLGALVAVGAAAVVTGAAGRLLLARTLDVVNPSRVALPPAAVPRPPVPADAALAVEGIAPLFTPNDDFYRIDTALTIPRIDAARWSLRLHGLVEREVVLTYDDLLAMPLVEADITIACVSNEVGGPLVGTARWLGARLPDVLDLAGPKLAATQVVGRSVDGFTAGFRTAFARDGRDALVAVGMNGEPLPARHGFPARLVVPGLFGYVSATKWLAEIELTTWEGFDGYWVPRGWDKQARVLLQSRFDTPATGARLPREPVDLAGVAWEPEKASPPSRWRSTTGRGSARRSARRSPPRRGGTGTCAGRTRSPEPTVCRSAPPTARGGGRRTPSSRPAPSGRWATTPSG
jgi:DMSO/TMAO reductase YedYZ molybdopterin-dependent catalytic subunit